MSASVAVKQHEPGSRRLLAMSAATIVARIVAPNGAKV